MDFSIYNNDKSKLNKLNIKANTDFSQIQKKIGNDTLNSVWKIIDNGDNIVQKNELDLLNKLLNAADNTVDGQKGNNKLDSNELSKLLEKINNGSIREIFNRPETGTINTQKEKLKNYSYIDNVSPKPTDLKPGDYRVRLFGYTPGVVNVDYSELKALKKDEYYIDSYKREENEDGTFTEKPVIRKKQAAARNKSDWSEGVDRRIHKINLAANNAPSALQLKEELEAIGKEVGFEVESINIPEDKKYGLGMWMEDYGIRRADGKMLVIGQNSAKQIEALKTDREKLVSSVEHRKNIATSWQGSGAQYADEFATTIRNNEKVESKSYLEGGNVLNTKLKDGTPGAIIGEESLTFTLEAMGLENTEENIKLAKAQIAEDLGLKEENITFIPQYDFHIDMNYRPLHNGQVAVPDFEEAIKVLTETNIDNMKAREKAELIKELEELNEKTAPIREEAEKALTEKGYTLVKIPHFATRSKSTINFMNGIGGTAKNGDSYYITNHSEYPDLNDAISEYLKKAGIDKTYFVTTTKYLKRMGGVDCLTQET